MPNPSIHLNPRETRNSGASTASSIIAIIMDPGETRKILQHLVKIGRSPDEAEDLHLWLFESYPDEQVAGDGISQEQVCYLADGRAG